MYGYSAVQWVFFFYFYCFFGWCFESAYCSIKSRRLTNRGFMRGPFLPIYGSGAIMMLVVSGPFLDQEPPQNYILIYLAGCLGATVLEYVTGVLMEALFKVRYWDYSQNRFNFQGHICLGSSLAWGFLTLLMTQLIQPRVETLILAIPGNVLTEATVVLTAGIGVDFGMSFKAALDLRDVLEKLDKARREMGQIQKRLDAIIDQAGEQMGQYTAGFGAGLTGMYAGIESRFAGLKEAAAERSGQYFEDVREEVVDLLQKYRFTRAILEQSSSVVDFFRRDMLRSNPTMVSPRFGESLKELQEKALHYHKGQHDDAEDGENA